MAEAILGCVAIPHLPQSHHAACPKRNAVISFPLPLQQRSHSSSPWNTRLPPGSRGGRRNATLWRVNAYLDWPLMAVLIQHAEGQRDLVLHKYLWHLSDQTIKSVYTFYIMFTVWGCCVFGSMKDPYYDSEAYRGDGGDGTGHWVYEGQEDIEEAARAELWREELIEEIEQKVGGLRELEEAGKKREEIVK